MSQCKDKKYPVLSSNVLIKSAKGIPGGIAVDGNKAYTLTEVAKNILENCDGTRDVNQLIRKVGKVYGVDSKEALSDEVCTFLEETSNFLEEAEEAGLIGYNKKASKTAAKIDIEEKDLFGAHGTRVGMMSSQVKAEAIRIDPCAICAICAICTIIPEISFLVGLDGLLGVPDKR